MLNRLEISGFKSFTDFEVDFAPLTVIAGANASGKSNLIEALQLIKGLVQKGTFGDGLSHQGNFKGLFTKLDGVDSANSIFLSVEFSIPKQYLQELGDGLIIHTELRYEVEITHRPDSSIGILFEISQERLYTNDEKHRVYLINNGAPDKRDEISKSHTGNYVFTTMEWTELSEASISSDPHVFASRRLLSSIIFADLIAPSNFSDYERLKDFNGPVDPNAILPSLVRLKKADGEHLHYLSQRVRQIVSDIASVDVYTDDFGRSTITATDTQGRRFLASNLSEGTLRVIALVSYLLKRKSDQVLLIEEPENGIDPRVITEMLSLILDLSISHDKRKGEQWQVICTTHSPILLQAVLNIDNQENIAVLLTNKVGYLSNIGEKRYKLKATRMSPIIPQESINGSNTALELYTLREAMEYLSPITKEKITEDA